VFASEEVRVGVPQLSVAVGVVHVGVALHCIVEGPGNAEIVGAVLSITLMICDAVAVLAHASVAVHFLVIV
jgi:hypothetical protein